MSDYYRAPPMPLFDSVRRLNVAMLEAAKRPNIIPPRARATDPETSHEAAAAVADFEADHHAMILDALRIGPAGATAIASRCGLGRDQVGKRMVELERGGVVVVDGTEPNANGRNERRYRLQSRSASHGV